MMRQAAIVGLVLFMVVFVASTGAGEENGMDFIDDPEKLQSIHNYFSASCFNKCWEMIKKTERTADNEEDMILLSYASLWHWKQRDDCEPLNLCIAYWQLSRVHSLCGEYDGAKAFGEKCLKLSLEHEVPPFYIGYAYEALAYSEIINGDFEKAREYLSSAESELEKTVDEGAKKLLEADILRQKEMIPAD